MPLKYLESFFKANSPPVPDKSSPLKYLESFLKAHLPPVPDKFEILDQDSKLFQNPKVQNIFRKYDYVIHCTGANTSFQNGAIEWAHRTVATSVQALLFGAGLPVKFWSYTSHHVICIRNVLPHCGQEKAPIEFAHKRKDNFKNLKTFGCRICVRPPGIQSKRFKDNNRQGIFLDYVPHTDRLFTWYDKGTHQAKIATHAKLDEGFNNLPIDNLPLNCQHIFRLNGQPISIDDCFLSLLDLEFLIYPFANTETAVIDFNPKAKDNFLGFKLLDDDLTSRNFIQDIEDNVSTSVACAFGTISNTQQKLRGSFITCINDVPVFSTDLARAQLQIL